MKGSMTGNFVILIGKNGGNRMVWIKDWLESYYEQRRLCKISGYPLCPSTGNKQPVLF